MWFLAWILIFFSDQVKCGESPDCYDELGCFPTAYPWTSLSRPLFPAPEAPDKIDTQIYCYTRDSPQRYNVTLWPQIFLEGCPFSADRTTMFLTHGFAHNGDLPWLADLKDNYLEATDANVFIVDWKKGARLPNYLLACSNTRLVGAEITRFIKYLQTEHSLKASDLHLIGHSLGAHIMSYVAKNTSGSWRLTGLDPAQPGFESSDKIVRLDKTDADFVDVIHTNALPLIGLGYVAPHGDVDFYVNGGGRQPLCETSDLETEIKSMKDLTKILSEATMQTLFACSHNRAYKYFTDTLLNNCTLWGRRASMKSTILKADFTGILDSILNDTAACDADSCIPMGLDTPNYKARGVFDISTPLVAPFCDDPETNRKISSELSQSSTEKKQMPVQSEYKAAKKTANLASGFSNTASNLFGSSSSKSRSRSSSSSSSSSN